MIKWRVLLSSTLFFTVLGLYLCSYNLPSPHDPIQIYATTLYNNLQTLTKTVIESASKDLIISSYQLTDPVIAHSIEKQLDKGLKTTTILYGKTHQLDISNHIHHKVILDNKSGLMHRKIILCDSSISYLGSTNLTESSMRLHHNLWIGVYSKELAEFLKKNLLYPHLNKNSFWSGPIGNSFVECWLCPDLSGVYQRIINLIESAKKSIHVAYFAWTHPVISKLLIKKHNEGITVTAIFDGTLLQKVSRKSAQLLKKNNIPVYRSLKNRLMHHKMIWIDDKIFLSGSLNMTKSALYKNRESILIISDVSDINKQKINCMFKNLYYESRPY